MYNKEYHKQWRQRNKLRLSKKDALWRKIHPNYHLKYCKKWHKQNQEKVILYGMKRRCNNKDHRSYTSYGGRGIKCFINTAQELIKLIGKRPGLKYSVDRIDNNGNYIKGNIRWATSLEQAHNKRKYGEKGLLSF